MTLADLFAITPYPAVSAVIWIALIVAVLYLARHSAHTVIQILCQALHDALNVAEKSIGRAEEILNARNRQVLLAAGQETQERIIEREFERVGASVKRDLAGYPGLQRTLSESIREIEDAHQNAVDVPPDPPAWIEAVEVIAKLDNRSDGSVAEILGNIHSSLVKAQDKAIHRYRAASRKRHELLRKMMPHWRRIQETLNRVNKNVDSLLTRSQSIDRHMQEYAEISRGTDRAVQVLSSSSLVQFFISGLVLAVAMGGATINFSLIARPMAEMVGGTSMIAGIRTADIAALVIIMVEVSMGLFLMESLRITRLFPVIGALPDKLRIKMIWITFTLLLALASVEAGLAYMREILMQDELATAEVLRGGSGVITNDFAWITTAAQMGMGFALPFALVFVAIPLETFVHSLRTVVGLIGIGLLRFLRLLLHLLSNFFLQIGAALLRIYDLLIFLPLWIESMAQKGADHGKIGGRGRGRTKGYQEA